MNTFFRRLAVVSCLGIFFLSSLGFSQSWRDRGEEREKPIESSQTTNNNGNPNPETNGQKQGDEDGKSGSYNQSTGSVKNSDEGQNNDSANRWDTSEKTATQLKREAVQQDFDGIIPSPGIVQLDRDGNPVGDIGSKIKDGTVELGDIFIIIIKMMDLLLKAAGTIAVLAIMYGGFQYMLSGFTDEKENAKNTIKWAVVGLIISFLAWLIITVVKTQMTKSPDEYEREAAASSASTTQEFTK